MGIDYYACQLCSNTFPDCGEYDTCGCCGSHFCKSCGEKQEKRYGYFETDEDGNDESEDEKYQDYYTASDGNLKACDKCSLNIVDNHVMVEFLLKKFKVNRKNAEKEIREKYVRNHKTGKLVLK